MNEQDRIYLAGAFDSTIAMKISVDYKVCIIFHTLRINDDVTTWVCKELNYPMPNVNYVEIQDPVKVTELLDLVEPYTKFKKNTVNILRQALALSLNLTDQAKAILNQLRSALYDKYGFN